MGQLEGAALISPGAQWLCESQSSELPPQEPQLPGSRRWGPSCNDQFLDSMCSPSTLEALSPSPSQESAGCSWPWEQRHLLSGGLFMSLLAWEYISRALTRNYEPYASVEIGNFFTKLARDRNISQDFQEKITLGIDVSHNKTKILPTACRVLCELILDPTPFLLLLPSTLTPLQTYCASYSLSIMSTALPPTVTAGPLHLLASCQECSFPVICLLAHFLHSGPTQMSLCQVNLCHPSGTHTFSSQPLKLTLWFLFY